MENLSRVYDTATYADLRLLSKSLDGVLRDRFAAGFVEMCRDCDLQLCAVRDSVSLMVSIFPHPYLTTLRLMSTLSGASQWRHEWDGSLESAVTFVDEGLDQHVAAYQHDRGLARQSRGEHDLGAS